MDALYPGHTDVIYNVSYDFYGRRMATCSADHTLKVFDKVDGKWLLNDSWRAHDGAVVQASWAGPGYPELLASASHDSTVRIWEEETAVPTGSGKRWKLRHTVSDYKGPLYDLKFSASRSNLKFAAIAADGVLRIHEAVDPNNLTYWAPVAEVPLLNHPVAHQLQSSFAISWCPSLLLDDHLAVCILEDAFIYRRNSSGRYIRVAELPMHKGLIRDVKWAPSMGRSFHLVATASKDGHVRVFKLTKATTPHGDDSKEKTHEKEFDVELVHDDSSFKGEVWRVSWNLSGTVLASSGDDNTIGLWKSTHLGQFQQVAVITGDQRQGNGVQQL